MDRRILRGLGGCALAMAIASSPVAAQVALEGIVVTSTKTSEAAIDALSGSSALSRKQIDEQFQSDSPSQFLMTIPGVTTAETARDPALAVNIRGLQDFGRVNVLIEGARQNFQRSGHNANGVFYVEPEMLKGVDITRGPTSVIYGSGAIGGVAAFSLLDADDILKPGEVQAVRTRARYATNGDGTLFSHTGAMKVGNFDVLGQLNFRSSGNYEDGAGREVTDSGQDTDSKLIKTRWRPAPGHQITGTVVDYQSQFIDRPGATSTTRRDSDIENQQYTLGYTFSRPDAPLLDFSAKAYKVHTNLAQKRLSGSEPPGSFRTFDIETEGFDVSNTSRFKFGSTKLALTYGGDAFTDRVETADTFGSANKFTPGGERRVSGAFVQSQLTFFDTVDIIAALRYDSYEISGDAANLDGSRASPKITVGYTPIRGVTLFGTYAEGYRAPAVTETLIAGFHPAPRQFEFLPNPNLRPEVAHNTEGGVNLKFDNLLKKGDAFRGRVVVFQNKVDDFIDAVSLVDPLPFGSLQYQNIANATLEGIEIEGVYDARAWFFGLAAHRIRGTNEETGFGLLTVPADRVTFTVGNRAFDDRLILGARVHLIADQDRLPPPTPGGPPSAIVPTDGYALVDLFGQYQVNESATVHLNIDNLFDKNYRQFLDQSNSPGFSARVGVTMRFGVTPEAAAP